MEYARCANELVTRSRRWDWVLLVSLLIIVALASLRLPVYYKAREPAASSAPSHMPTSLVHPTVR